MHFYPYFYAFLQFYAILTVFKEAKSLFLDIFLLKINNVRMKFKVYAIFKRGNKSFLKSTMIDESSSKSALEKAEAYFYALAKKQKEASKYKIVMYKNV